MLRLAAKAKINWTLDILGTREDGYHEMDMLMSSVELSDTLEMEPADGLALTVMGEIPVFAQGDNLVLKAARALQKATGCSKGANMRLYKHIPVGAGMGGGSADAAAALKGLADLWSLSISRQELMQIGRSLGADVPFMLTGGVARVGGMGETIKPLPVATSIWLVLTQPCRGLSTAEIFQGFDSLPSQDIFRPETDRAEMALREGDLQNLARSMGNVMEPISLAKRPEMGEAKEALKEQGALRAMMTGSGSVVYGVFDTETKARKAFESLRAKWDKTYVTKTLETGMR